MIVTKNLKNGLLKVELTTEEEINQIDTGKLVESVKKQKKE